MNVRQALPSIRITSLLDLNIAGIWWSAGPPFLSLFSPILSLSGRRSNFPREAEMSLPESDVNSQPTQKGPRIELKHARAALHDSWIDDTILENDESITEWTTRAGTTSLPAKWKLKPIPQYTFYAREATRDGIIDLTRQYEAIDLTINREKSTKDEIAQLDSDNDQRRAVPWQDQLDITGHRLILEHSAERTRFPGGFVDSGARLQRLGHHSS
jgi:hypothetical protein